MSNDAVELVKSVQPRPHHDLTQTFCNDDRWARVRDFLAPLLQPDFESGFVRGAERISYRDIDGFRQTWIDWLEPWESYRTEALEFVPNGAHVLVIVNDYGRRPGMDAEVRMRGAAVWTVQGGKLARAFFYTDRAEAATDAGLSTALLADLTRE